MSSLNTGGIEVKGITSLEGPLLVIEGVGQVMYDEIVEITGQDGVKRLGNVLEADEKFAVVEVFSGTGGLSAEGTTVRFTGQPLRVPVSREMLGRVFNSFAEPIDNYPLPIAQKFMDINGQIINPASRVYPEDYLQTGVSVLDVMNTLIMGQKLPVFSGAGLPHDQLAAQIVRQAQIGQIAGSKQASQSEFSIVFAAMGVKHDVAEFFREEFLRSGALNRVAMFLNLADDPTIERLITPRTALTLAEYLAFECNHHVLVVMLDMTNYAEALRQISNKRGEVPARKGYPGYMYSNMASLYERTGRIKTSKGSITQIPILTMPNDDITHPIPDISGYITEGQIVLSRSLFQQDIYPPISVMPSLSRLMKDGIGEGKSRADHPHLSSQLYAAYARVQDVRSLASVIGEDELPELDRQYLKFGKSFENEFLKQRSNENRDMETSLDMAWDLLSILPRTELIRLSEAELDMWYKA
ncbi:MAG: V-type ATP synthase subunit B [Chloroflexi bacterium]|jgi:V/A-type H+-transporting ATPase subunit B|nr:V-type ATP synthase subunit B [Chloroflexota bacterium]